MCDPSKQHHSHFESDEESGISAFGYPKTNHGWVECASKSFPGQTYYFNVDTCCSTWHRPVSRFVPTRISRPLNLMSDDDFLDVAPIDVSDIEDDNDYEEEDSYEEEINPDLPPDADDVKPPMIFMRKTKESGDAKIYADVLFKLYHCYSREWDDNENEVVAPLNSETLDDDLNENFQSILPETCYSSDSEGESKQSEFETATDERMNSETSEESFVEISREDDYPFRELDCLKVLHTNDEGIKNREHSSNISASSASDVDSRDFGLSSDDEDEDEEDEMPPNECHFSLPRLKAIEFADLARPRKIRKKIAKKRRSSNNDDETLKGNPPNKMIKIVCEVNGITTVNYDYYEPQLPCGVKMSNLSDSGSSECYDTWYSQQRNNANINCPEEKSIENPKSFVYLNDFKDFNEPDLSDSSSSSSTDASTLQARRNEAKNIRMVTKDSKNKENSSSESSSSSSSSESSWKTSGSSSEGD